MTRGRGRVFLLCLDGGLPAVGLKTDVFRPVGRVSFLVSKESGMKYRVLSLAVFALALVAYLATPSVTLAAEDSHHGFVVKAGGGELKMTDKDGKNEHTHRVPAEAQIMRNGKAAMLSDLEKGDHVTVTTKTDSGKTWVVKIEAKSKVQ